MSFLFDTPVYESYGISDSVYESVMDDSSISLAEILAENTISISTMLSSLYVADSIAEAMVIDGAITEESAVSVLEGSIQEFCDNAIQKFHDTFEKVKAWLKKRMEAIQDFFNRTARTIHDNIDAIKKNVAEADKDMKVIKGYLYNLDALETVEELEVDFALEVDKVMNNNDNGTDYDSAFTWKTKMAEDGYKAKEKTIFFGENSVSSLTRKFENFAAFKEDITKQFRGEKIDITAGMVLNNFDSISGLTQVKPIIKGIKKGIKTINKMEADTVRAIRKGAKGINKSNGMATEITKTIRVIKDAVNSYTSIEGLLVDFLKEGMVQSTKILKKFMKGMKPNKKEKGEENEVEVEDTKTEESSLFTIALKMI